VNKKKASEIKIQRKVKKSQEKKRYKEKSRKLISVVGREEKKRASSAQGCQIESKSNRILLSNRMFLQRSNRMFLQRSNRMEIESNDFFDFRYDLIRFDLEENVSKKTLNCDGEKLIISADGMSNEIFQYFCHPGGQSL
jgi:hypothetical protein